MNTPNALTPEFKKYDIFISYRKDSSLEKAEALYHYLHNGKYKDKVFRDVDELKAGDWIDQIVDIVDNAKLLVLILDKKTFENRDISNDTSKQYERWAKLSRVELHDEIDSMSQENRDKINYIRLEILRAKVHNLIILPIVYKDRKDDETIHFNRAYLPKDLQTALYNCEQIETWIFDETKNWLNTVTNEWTNKVDDILFSSQHIKQGKNIQPTDIYFDQLRATKKYGFDEKFYIPRKVDEELVQYVESSNKPFCFVTGLPGSGKTRAIYQLCHGALSEKSVLVLNRTNIKTIVELLNNPTSVIDSNYFICDQIADVLSWLDDSVIQKFINTLCDARNNYHLICSNTKSRLDDFLSKYDEYLNNNFQCIEIPIVDDTIIRRLLKLQKKKYSGQKGKTIADFIPGINNYKKDILEKVLKKVDDSNLLEAWLKSLQLVMTFRKEYPLFLAVLIFRKLFPGDASKLPGCIKAMLEVNMLYIQDNAKSIKASDIGKRFIKLNISNEKFPYDGEDFPSVMGMYKDGKNKSDNCTFEVNELIWQYLQDNNGPRKKEDLEEVLYNLNNADDLEEAIQTYYNVFPTLSSLRRIVPRVPYDSVQAIANAKVIEILENNYINQVDDIDEATLAEIQLIYSLIIGRCKNDDEVEAYLQQLIAKKIINEDNYPGTIIGELYRYVENTSLNNHETFVYEKILPKRRYVPLKDSKIDTTTFNILNNLKADDLYAIAREIAALQRLKKIKLDFKSLHLYITKCFDRLNLKEKNASVEDKLLLNIDRLLSLLVRYSNAESNNIEKISKLLNEYNLLDQESRIYPLYTIFKYLAKYADGNPKKCRCIVDQLLYINHLCEDDNWNLNNAFPKVREFFGRFIVSAIAQADTFSDAKELYELYVKGLEKKSVTLFIEEHADKYKVLSMAMRKCVPTEFQTMVQYLEGELSALRKQLKECKQKNEQIKIWHINYTIKVLTNLIMEKTPSQTDALYYLEQLDDKQVDSYALFHILNKILLNSKRDEQFIWACAAINHPKLKQYRSEGPILNLLYKTTNDIEQEKLVDEIAGEKWKENKRYVSIKLGKPFRSLSEKWDLYQSFYANLNHDDQLDIDQRYVDLFSTLTNELRKAKKRYDTLTQDCTQLKKDLTKAQEYISNDTNEIIGHLNNLDEEKENLLNHITKIKPLLKEECKKDFRDKDSDPYYTLALIQLDQLKVFDEENQITDEFRNNHLPKFINTKFWNKLISFFYNSEDIDTDKKIKALCQLYKETYESTKRSYNLRPDPIMHRNLKKVGLSIDGTNEAHDLEYEVDNMNDENEVDFFADNYLDDNDLIFTEDENGNVKLNDHFAKLKQSDEAQDVIWWTKKMNYFKKQKENIKCDCIYNAYMEVLDTNSPSEALSPDWIMYKYAYDKGNTSEVFNSCKFIKKELEDTSIIPSRLADVLEHICKLQKKRIAIPTIAEIIEIIDRKQLWNMITIDHRSLVSLYLFIVRQGLSGQAYLSDYKDKFENISKFTTSNLKSLGELSREQILMTNNSLRHSFYFYKWLKEYLEIYKSEDVFLQNYTNDGTIKIHIQKHLNFDYFFEKYLNDNDEYKPLIDEIRRSDVENLVKETIISMLAGYKKYTIENLKKIYHDLSAELQTQLVVLKEDASINDIVEALNKYADLKDDIIEHYVKYYRTNKDENNLLKAAILGSVDAQYEYGVTHNDNHMIWSAAINGHKGALILQEKNNTNKIKNTKIREHRILKQQIIELWNQADILKQEKQYTEAIKLYEKLVGKRVNNHYPETQIGHCYKCLKDIENAKKWYHKAEERGCFFASYDLYNIYKKDNIEEAITHLIIAAKKGHINAPTELFNCLHSTSVSPTLIIQISEVLVQMGHTFNAEEWFKYGKAHHQQGNHSESIECYKHAAEMEHAGATLKLWKIHVEGKYVTKSLTLTRDWMQKAANTGDISAEKEIKNLNKAMNIFQQGITYYKEAASYNSNPYLKAQQEAKYKNAIEKFLQAATMGLAEASHYLGICHFKGWGTEKNTDKAIEYYKTSAEQGYDSSQFSLGQIYESKNIDEAKKWYQLAADQGHEKAKHRLEQLTIS